MKLMIVGADPDMRQRVTAWFSIDAEDHVVETNGILEALGCATQWHPDVIVFDAPPGDGRRRQMVSLINQVWPDASLLVPVWPKSAKPAVEVETDGCLSPYAWNSGLEQASSEAVEAATVSLLWYQPGLTLRH